MSDLKIAVDIGSSSIKLVEGFQKKSGCVITKAGMLENPFPHFRENLVEKEQNALAHSLKEYLTLWKSKKTVCSISGTDVIIHYFTIPELPEKEIASAVQLEALQVIPAGLENLDYDYGVLNHSGEKTVIFAGYPKEKCGFFTNLLVKSGLKPLIMDHDGLALNRSAETGIRDSENIQFIINAGSKYTNVCIAEKNGFILVRDIRFGGADLTAYLAKKFSLPLNEAEKYKKNPANSKTVAEIVREVTGELNGDISVALGYFSSKTGKKPSRFFLTGGSAALAGLKEHLAENLHLEGTVWNPLESLTGGSVPLDLKDYGRHFAVALGLLGRKLP